MSRIIPVITPFAVLITHRGIELRTPHPELTLSDDMAKTLAELLMSAVQYRTEAPYAPEGE